MTIELTFQKKKYKADLQKPIDISLPLREGADNPNCYWAEPVRFETIVSGNFIGSVKAGGSVNYQKLSLTPHGNGTHTECYGHISTDPTATINSCLTSFHFIAELISLIPKKTENGDEVVTLSSLKEKIRHLNTEALIIRTLPQTDSKKKRQYSGTNPPYLEASISEYLAGQNVLHLLIDLPSVDREHDEGKLAGHRAFWKYPEKIRTKATISELIYVDNSVPDGLYLINLQIASLEMDASPSKPILYKLEEVS
jgi:arylformamidase